MDTQEIYDEWKKLLKAYSDTDCSLINCDTCPLGEEACSGKRVCDYLDDLLWLIRR